MKRFFKGSPTSSDRTPERKDESTPLVPTESITVSSSTKEKVPADDATVLRSGNPTKSVSSKRKSTPESLTLEQELAQAKEQIAQEKAGKRKLFHSLVKLANELRRTRSETVPLMERQKYVEQTWYEGGMWRAPQVLPGIEFGPTATSEPPDTPGAAPPTPPRRATTQYTPLFRTTRIREAVSLSDLFFNLVIITAFTRVGVAITETGKIDFATFVYFAIFWTIWSKQASYSTRFDTTDLSASMTTLITCFAVLFASLSVQAPIASEDANRIMILAAFVAILYCGLHVRVLLTQRGSDAPLAKHVSNYAIYNMVVTALEAAVWLFGVLVMPMDWKYRWVVFVVALLLALRIPRAFLANDFHAACSKRGVLFILLLGFLLQSVMVVASEFFEYQTPTPEHYSFIGAVCLMFFCIKLLYVDDSNTLAEDHALLVNRWAGFFFNMGQFTLLLSTTVMGSGLNILTHSYLAATAALPGPEKALVCGGFSATVLSTFFIKSMHLKRVPTDPRNQALFIMAYVVQSVVLLVVVGVTAAMSLGNNMGGFLEYLMQNDIQLLFSLSVSALFLVLMSWLDEGVELLLYKTVEDSRAFRVHPFGFWWCLKEDVSDQDVLNEMQEESNLRASRSLSVLSPLLGSSVASSMRNLDEYDSIPKTETDV